MQDRGLEVERFGQGHHHRPRRDVDQTAVGGHRAPDPARGCVWRGGRRRSPAGETEPTEQTLSFVYCRASQATMISSTVAGASACLRLAAPVRQQRRPGHLRRFDRCRRREERSAAPVRRSDFERLARGEAHQLAVVGRVVGEAGGRVGTVRRLRRWRARRNCAAGRRRGARRLPGRRRGGTISSTVTNTSRAAKTALRSSPRPPWISTLPSSSARWAWSRKTSSGKRPRRPDLLPCDRIVVRRREPGSFDDLRTRPGAGRASTALRAGRRGGPASSPARSTPPARPGPSSTAVRKRGARPKTSRLLKQSVILRTASASSSNSNPRLPPQEM